MDGGMYRCGGEWQTQGTQEQTYNFPTREVYGMEA